MINPIIYRIGLVIVAVLLASCSTQSTKPANILVEVQEPNRIRFQGKGAGAGMMLSSSMGPMGIAIGVAIDEGIGKDIDKAAVASGFNIEELVKVHFANSKSDLNIKVERYGFKLYKSEDNIDWIVPTLDLEIIEGSTQLFVQYQIEAQEEVPVIELEKARVDGNISIMAFSKALKQIAEYYSYSSTQR